MLPHLGKDLTSYVVSYVPSFTIAATDEYGSVYLWDAMAPEHPRLLGHHRQAATDIKFFPDGERLVTTSHDGTAIIWNVSSGEQLAILRGNGYSVSGIVIFPAGDRVITFGAGGVYVWDAASGARLRMLVSPDGHLEVAKVELVRGSEVVLVLSESLHAEFVSLWHAATGEQIAPPWRLPCWNCRIARLDDGRLVSCEGSRYRSDGYEPWSVLDAVNGTRLSGAADFEDGDSADKRQRARCIAVSNDGRMVAEVLSETEEVLIRDILTGEALSGPLGASTPMWRVVFAEFAKDGSFATLFEFPTGNIDGWTGHAFAWDFRSRAPPRPLGTVAVWNTGDYYVGVDDFVITRRHSAASVWHARSGRRLVDLEVPSAAAAPGTGHFGERRVQLAISGQFVPPGAAVA